MGNQSGKRKVKGGALENDNTSQDMCSKKVWIGKAKRDRSMQTPNNCNHSDLDDGHEYNPISLDNRYNFDEDRKPVPCSGIYIPKRSDDREHIRQDRSRDVHGYPTQPMNVSRSDSNIASDLKVYIRPFDIREEVERKHTSDKFHVNKDTLMLKPDVYSYPTPHMNISRSDGNIGLDSNKHISPWDIKEGVDRKHTMDKFQSNKLKEIRLLNQDVNGYPTSPMNISRSDSNVDSDSKVYISPCDIREDEDRKHAMDKFHVNKDRWQLNPDYGYMIPQSTASWSDINVNLPSGVYNIPHGKKAEINRQDTTDIFKFNEERSSLNPEMDINKQKMPPMHHMKSECFGYSNSGMHKSVVSKNIETSRGIRMKNPLQADYKQSKSKDGHSYSTLPQQHRSYKRETKQRREYFDQFERDAGLETGSTEIWNIGNLYVPTEELYVMNGDRSGLCVIFNMETVGSSSRFGTEIDVNGLKNSFGNLGFDLKVIHNPTRRTIKDYMNHVKSLDHHRKDSFVCVILSHGRDGHIRSSDNEDVPLLEIIEPVKSCESLIGKPKLFFVQACRGKKTDNGVWTDAVEDISDDNLRKLSLHSDLLVSYATIEDFVAYRNGKDGSIYIKILCYLLDKEGFTTKLTDILKKVNRMTLDAFGDSSVCQVPSFTSTLRKSVLFKQKQEKKIVKKKYYYDDGSRLVVNVVNSCTENNVEIFINYDSSDSEHV